MSLQKPLRALAALAALSLLSGCSWVVMSPSGDVAIQQRDLILYSTYLMLIVIVPVIILTFVFAWRYREKSAHAEKEYSPDWDHSTLLELLIWAIPLLIIIALGALTWTSTHLLDPYRPLDRIDAQRQVAADTEPLVVEVVSLDWKWLFIYPEQGIAVVNELAAPVDRPIQFKITSSAVMNSFFIPALAGQIYSMAGMQTTLHAVINRPGQYEGFSANYSGAGFSDMRFKFLGMSDGDFDQWIATNRDSGETLDRATYLQLEQPSKRDPVRRYGQVMPDMFHAILNRCVEPNRMCMDEMMAIDARGGLGITGTYAITSLDDVTREALGLQRAPVRTYVAAFCTTDDPSFAVAAQAAPTL